MFLRENPNFIVAKNGRKEIFCDFSRGQNLEFLKNFFAKIKNLKRESLIVDVIQV